MFEEFFVLFNKLFTDGGQAMTADFKMYSVRIYADGTGGVDELNLRKQTSFGIAEENEVFGFSNIKEALEILNGSVGYL